MSALQFTTTHHRLTQLRYVHPPSSVGGWGLAQVVESYRHNQWWYDAIEAMNAALLPPPAADAQLHSEGPGMKLGPLSILELRESHPEELARDGHVDCGRELPQSGNTRSGAQVPDAKLRHVRRKREWLKWCLDELLLAPGGGGFSRYVPASFTTTRRRIRSFTEHSRRGCGG